MEVRGRRRMIKNLIIAQELRKRSTDAEKLIWKYLRKKQLDGLKFRRQQPIGDYIVDFVCFEKIL
jgi:very-short-patch-repair endonuclease